MKGISGKTWRKGLCKEEQGKTELKQLADDCRKTEGGCTKANCLALCYKSHGLKACEYFKPPQTRPNCVAFLYGVKKEPESNSDAFCYFTETTHKTNCNCKKIEVQSTGLANQVQKNSMGIFVRHSRKDGITSYRNGKDVLLSGGPNKHWIISDEHDKTTLTTRNSLGEKCFANCPFDCYSWRYDNKFGMVPDSKIKLKCKDEESVSPPNNENSHSDNSHSGIKEGYHTYNGYQCGGKRIDKWNDGDDSDSGKTIKDLPTCKKICSQHSECKAFELSKETTNCNYWIKGPLFPTQDITETHDCYVQKRALKCVSTNRNQGSDDQWCAESYMKNPDCLNGGDCKFEVNNMYESNPNVNTRIETNGICVPRAHSNVNHTWCKRNCGQYPNNVHAACNFGSENQLTGHHKCQCTIESGEVLKSYPLFKIV